MWWNGFNSIVIRKCVKRVSQLVQTDLKGSTSTVVVRKKTDRPLDIMELNVCARCIQGGVLFL